MDVPSIENRLWSDVVSGKLACELNFLALKILLGRLNLIVRQDPAPSNVQKCAKELREFFLKNAGMPSAQRDLETLLKTRGVK